MKNVLLLIIGISFFACHNSKKQTIITGLLTHSQSKIVKLKIADSVYIDTLKDRKYYFSIPIKKNYFVKLNIGKTIDLYVKPQDSINLKSYKNEVVLSGKGIAESKYLQNKKEFLNKLGYNDSKRIDKKLFSSTYKNFRKKIDSIKQIRINHLNNYNKIHSNLSEEFLNTEQKLINYFWINQLMNYPNFYKMLTQKEALIPQDSYDFTKYIEFDDSNLLSFKDYKRVLASYLNYKSNSIIEKYNLAKKLFKIKPLFQEIMFHEFNSYINFKGIENIESICKEFTNSLSNSKHRNYIQEKIKRWKRIQKGSQAPNFTIQNETGNLVSLSNFKGKYVYVNCWSSFCGPCLAELPSLKKLIKSVNRKDIAYITICFDKDLNTGINKLQNMELNTINLFANGMRHNFSKEYNIRALPRYILIDKKGKIIDATALKPSKIRKTLELLK